jgi:hypothetical protein
MVPPLATDCRQLAYSCNRAAMLQLIGGTSPSPHPLFMAQDLGKYSWCKIVHAASIGPNLSRFFRPHSRTTNTTND